MNWCSQGLPSGTFVSPSLLSSTNVIGLVVGDALKVYEIELSNDCLSAKEKASIGFSGDIWAWGYNAGAVAVTSVANDSSGRQIFVARAFIPGATQVFERTSPLDDANFSVFAVPAKAETFVGYLGVSSGSVLTVAKVSEDAIDYQNAFTYKINAMAGGVSDPEGNRLYFIVPYNGQMTAYELDLTSDDAQPEKLGSFDAKPEVSGVFIGPSTLTPTDSVGYLQYVDGKLLVLGSVLYVIDLKDFNVEKFDVGENIKLAPDETGEWLMPFLASSGGIAMLFVSRKVQPQPMPSIVWQG